MKINGETIRYAPNQSIELKEYYLSLFEKWLLKSWKKKYV